MSRRFKNWLQAYIHHTRFSESPDPFHFWTGVSTIAGALGRKVWIEQRVFQWTPNFYIVLVGPPGVAAKSTSVRQGLKLLEALSEHEAGGIHFGPQSMTWQALTESLSRAQMAEEIPGLQEPEIMSCLTISISELGTFLRPDDKDLVDVLVDMWDGQKTNWRRSTRTQGDTVIKNPWLNVIGCTTPAWLKDNFPDVLIGGGLTSRIIFIFANKKRQLVAYPANLVTPDKYQEEEGYLIEDLAKIHALKGPYTLDEEATKWGEKWYENLWMGDRPKHLASERLEGYISRKQSHIHKLAIVLAAAQRDEMVITCDDLQMADQFVTMLEGDMIKVFSNIGQTQESKSSNEILNLIRHHKQIEYRALFRLMFNTMSERAFVDALESCIKAGYVGVKKEGTQKFIISLEGPVALSG